MRLAKWARWSADPHDPENSKHIAARMVVRVRKRAKACGREMTVTWEDLIPLPVSCLVLGYRLIYMSQTLVPAIASIDRIDSSLGYTPENVRIISWRANTLRSNGTLEEMRAIVSDMDALSIWMETV